MDAIVKNTSQETAQWPVLKFEAEFHPFNLQKHASPQPFNKRKEWRLPASEVQGVASLLGFSDQPSARAIENTEKLVEGAMRSVARKLMPAGMSMSISHSREQGDSAAKKDKGDVLADSQIAKAVNSLEGLFEGLSNAVANGGEPSRDSGAEASQASFGGAVLIWPPRMDANSPCIALCIEPSAWRKASRSALALLAKDLALPAGRLFILSSEGAALGLGQTIAATLNSGPRHVWGCVEMRSAEAPKLDQARAAAERFYGPGAVWAAHVVPQIEAPRWDQGLPEMMSALLERDELEKMPSAKPREARRM